MVLSVVARCMSGEEEKMSLEIWCDLLEAELKRALEDLSVIRGLDKAQAKSKSHMLKALNKAVAENFRTATGIET
jgi:DNA-binding protein YbaB